MKKQTVHYGVVTPYCHTKGRWTRIANDRRRVTCENCIRTHAYKRSK